MKIAINGDIIDTENIYKITRIKCGGYTECLDGKYRFSTNILNPIINQFKIKLFNSSPIIIKVPYNKVNDLIDLRESIIKIWSENKSNIPQFNLK